MPRRELIPNDRSSINLQLDKDLVRSVSIITGQDNSVHITRFSLFVLELFELLFRNIIQNQHNRGLLQPSSHLHNPIVLGDPIGQPVVFFLLLRSILEQFVFLVLLVVILVDLVLHCFINNPVPEPPFEG